MTCEPSHFSFFRFESVQFSRDAGMSSFAGSNQEICQLFFPTATEAYVRVDARSLRKTEDSEFEISEGTIIYHSSTYRLFHSLFTRGISPLLRRFRATSKSLGHRMGNPALNPAPMRVNLAEGIMLRLNI